MAYTLTRAQKEALDSHASKIDTIREDDVRRCHCRASAPRRSLLWLSMAAAVAAAADGIEDIIRKWERSASKDIPMSEGEAMAQCDQLEEAWRLNPGTRNTEITETLLFITGEHGRFGPAVDARIEALCQAVITHRSGALDAQKAMGKLLYEECMPVAIMVKKTGLVVWDAGFDHTFQMGTISESDWAAFQEIPYAKRHK